MKDELVGSVKGVIEILLAVVIMVKLETGSFPYPDANFGG